MVSNIVFLSGGCIMWLTNFILCAYLFQKTAIQIADAPRFKKKVSTVEIRSAWQSKHAPYDKVTLSSSSCSVLSRISSANSIRQSLDYSN
jgi:hypothetical protein